MSAVNNKGCNERKYEQFPRFRIRKVAHWIGACLVPVVTGTLLWFSYPDNVYAGFVSDFVEEAKENSHVTEAGIREVQGLNVASVGSFVYRTPREEFVPLSVSAPSLKAGCGGIDLFLGAFSIPSKDEFVSFLRSVGTALPGLAFQLALQTMAPDLNEQVGRFSDLIRQYTNRYTDSCTAAQALMEETGANAHLRRAVNSARNALRATGQASDQSEADDRVRSNGEAAITNAPVRKDSQGSIIDAPEINLTWALLRATKRKEQDSETRTRSISQQRFDELVMTLVGTTIFEKSGTGADATIQEKPIAGVDLLPFLFNQNLDNPSYSIWSCDEITRCLKPNYGSVGDLSLVRAFHEAADNYLLAMRERNPALVSQDDLYLLGGTTGVPLIKVLNMATLSRYQGIARDMVSAYVEAAAFEMLNHAIQSLATDARAAIASSSAAAVSQEHAQHVHRILDRITVIESQLRAQEAIVISRMQRAMSLMEQLEYMEKSLMNTPVPSSKNWAMPG